MNVHFVHLSDFRKTRPFRDITRIATIERELSARVPLKLVVCTVMEQGDEQQTLTDGTLRHISFQSPNENDLTMLTGLMCVR